MFYLCPFSHSAWRCGIIISKEKANHKHLARRYLIEWSGLPSEFDFEESFYLASIWRQGRNDLEAAVFRVFGLRLIGDAFAMLH